MRLYAFEIPDQHSELTLWLEEHLVGANLAELVAELSAVNGSSAEMSLDDALEGQTERVCYQGLASLPRESLQQLLRQPRLLLTLQEEVLSSGAEYWDTVRRPQKIRRLERRGMVRLEESLGVEAADEPRIVRGPWYRHPLLVSVASAAAVLLAVMLIGPMEGEPVATQPSGWGWDRPSGLPEELPAEQYLLSLASSAEDWFNRRPEDAAGVARRISEFRQGCTTLILAEHKPLSDTRRQWLRDKCRAWAGKLDAHLADLEAGGDPLAIRAAADETINKLITALRDEPKQWRA